ncbi:hypothetical protein EYF80_007108 [Liparis tanakae]|uniref:Uncharacterized protein n=1 Tax=Liparis tanakae TaxID=230148 RepID=A0A4Z2IX87_9TELE|nr:hypothetical protein EYF80_007108 [Liparis tanakae]
MQPLTRPSGFGHFGFQLECTRSSVPAWRMLVYSLVGVPRHCILPSVDPPPFRRLALGPTPPPVALQAPALEDVRAVEFKMCCLILSCSWLPVSPTRLRQVLHRTAYMTFLFVVFVGCLGFLLLFFGGSDIFVFITCDLHHIIGPYCFIICLGKSIFWMLFGHFLVFIIIIAVLFTFVFFLNNIQNCVMELFSCGPFSIFCFTQSLIFISSLFILFYVFIFSCVLVYILILGLCF